MACGLLFVICLGYLLLYGWQARANRQLYTRLLGDITWTEEKFWEGEQGKYESETKDWPETPMDQLTRLVEQNPDCRGLLWIPGTEVRYPVVQTEREEGLYYLKRDFEGRSNPAGTLFLDYRCDEDADNLIIYGHRMRNGQMFGELKHYKNKEFGKEHSRIYWLTPERVRVYEIFAVCLQEDSGVLTEEELFYQQNFIRAEDPAQKAAFVEMALGKSLYDTRAWNTGEPEEEMEHFLTLKTCDYGVENGRLVVIARLAEEIILERD